MATEKRLIDAIALVSENAILMEDEYGLPYKCVLVEDIRFAPTVDAVEVVRCKDCFANGCCSVQIDLDMGDEGFCPKGRKEG